MTARARAPTDASYKAAYKLRRSMSLPEVVLWRQLRRSPHGIRVRRQHPLGPFVLDFYIASALLAVEIDGAAHRAGDGGIRDERRDRWCEEQDIETVRIAAAEVLANPERVADSIIDYAIARRDVLRRSGC